MEEPRLPLVSEIMVHDPVAVSRKTTAREAAKLMCQRNIGCVVVCDKGMVTGIFTERDLLRQVANRRWWKGRRVAKFMTPDPITVTADDTLMTVAEVLGRAYVRHLPVTDEGKLVGILSVRDMMRHRAKYLEWLVRQQTAELEAKNAALETRERLAQHHLEIAGRTQRRMLPPAVFELPPLSLAVGYHPLERVSGDYYDYAVLSPDRLGVLIADAAGHSVPAALVSVAAKAAFYAQGRKIDSPAAVLHAMNKHLLGLIEEEQFVTMFYAVVDRVTFEVTYATAGHCAPLRYRRQTATVEALEAQGSMLGMTRQPEFEEHCVRLDPGDRLLLYTDGLVECCNGQGTPFGRERAEAFLREHVDDGNEALVQQLNAELTQFRGSHPPSDDMTCIVLSTG